MIPGACMGNPNWPTSFSQSNSQRGWKINQSIAIPFIQVRPLHTTLKQHYTLHYTPLTTHYTLHTLHTVTLATQHSQHQHTGVIATELSRNLSDLYGWFGSVAEGALSIFAKSPLTGSLTSLYVRNTTSSPPPLSLSHPHNINLIPSKRYQQHPRLKKKG